MSALVTLLGRNSVECRLTHPALDEQAQQSEAEEDDDSHKQDATQNGEVNLKTKVPIHGIVSLHCYYNQHTPKSEMVMRPANSNCHNK